MNKILENKVVTEINNTILNELKGVCDVWCCGGALLSILEDKEISDIDLFFKNEYELNLCLKYLKYNKAKVFVDAEKVTKVVYKNIMIDLVKKFYDTPLDCINSFDFDICKIYVYQDKISHHDKFYSCFICKELTLSDKIEYPFSTFLRIQKYAKKGYQMPFGYAIKLYDILRKNEGKEIEEYYEEYVLS